MFYIYMLMFFLINLPIYWIFRSDDVLISLSNLIFLRINRHSERKLSILLYDIYWLIFHHSSLIKWSILAFLWCICISHIESKCSWSSITSLNRFRVYYILSIWGPIKSKLYINYLPPNNPYDWFKPKFTFVIYL